MPRFRLLWALTVGLGAGWLTAAPAEAGVVVLGNYTLKKLEFSVFWPDGFSRRYTLEPREVVPVATAQQVEVAFPQGKELRRWPARAGTIYCFMLREEQLHLVRVVYSAAEPAPPPPPLAGPPEGGETGRELEKPYTIPVMILADDDEPAVRRIWEQRFRERLAEASEIFQRHCFVRFEVVAVGTWVSDNRITNFEESLVEFERKVNPRPARVAIGFTSQYAVPRGATHLGGTRGPLYSHILIREWAQHVSKAERLEVLVHELGHYLGAAHSKDRSSVMRPNLGDRLANARSFHIGFDPVNTMIMNLVVEELRRGRYHGFAQIRPEIKAHLRSAYTGLEEMMRWDPAAKNYLELLDPVPAGVRHAN